MIRYYITDRKSANAPLEQLVAKAVQHGIDYVQIREKDLSGRDLLALCRAAVNIARGSATRILVNTRVDVALACGAAGVHLPGNSPPPSSYRAITPAGFVFGVSCHNMAEVVQAEFGGAHFVVLSPIFVSPGKGEPIGLTALGNVVQRVRIPVLALGGVTVTNAEDCISHGAAGVAGIRLFQE
jgi:thiamine-phosphate pyrophosphorylase